MTTPVLAVRRNHLWHYQQSRCDIHSPTALHGRGTHEVCQKGDAARGGVLDGCFVDLGKVFSE
ncbi:MAG: hypothetical protein HFH23_06070 [Ruminococcus sp.]|nr:hypothetical protein [Ruminococcus sp.]